MSLSHVHTTMKPTKNRVIIFGILSLIVVTSILNSIQIYFIATFEQPYPLHPISEYTQNIDLTKVPPRGSPPNLPSLKTSKSKRFEKNLTRKEQGTCSYKTIMRFKEFLLICIIIFYIIL